jgi:hypothetical protein
MRNVSSNLIWVTKNKKVKNDLSDNDKKIFFEAIFSDKKPNKALIKAYKKYKKFLNENKS